MNIELLKKEDESRWDEFVFRSERATYCHLLGWRDVIKESYNHQDLYLVAKDGKEIHGILPAFIIKHPLFGKKIISLPFFTYGGIIGQNQKAYRLLIEYLKQYLKENRYDYFEMRSLTEDKTLKAELNKVTFLIDLRVGANNIWQRMDKKLRNQIRKAKRSNFQFGIGNEHLSDFYELYQKTMKRVGTPVHSFNFFQKVVEQFPEAVNIFIARFESKIISALFFFNFKDTAINLWGASDEKFWKLNPNNFLYWEAIKYFLDKGFQYLDFGSTGRYSPTWHFKQQWGGIEKQIFYQYYYYKNKISPSFREKYGKFSSVWKILPNFITNKIGPKIRKYVP